MKRTLLLGILATALCGCSGGNVALKEDATAQALTQNSGCREKTAVSQFLDYANETMLRLTSNSEAMNWAYMTNITPDTEAALAASEEATMAEHSALIASASEFDVDSITCADHRRQLMRLKSGVSLAPPKRAEDQKALAAVGAKLVGYYGAATHCEGETCYNLGDLSKIMATSRDYDELKHAWESWHNAFDSQKPLYEEFARLGNQGARDIGFEDMAELWLSGYDMSGADFQKEVDTLWLELKPLYDALHCHVRAKLSEHYGVDKVALDKPIPAHLLGNMWAQEWSNIYPLVVPYKDAPNLDATSGIVAKNLTPVEMAQTVEQFYTSIGMRHLPKSFWTNSMFVKPADREVVCHASAWDIDTKGDVRIKMCIEPTSENLFTIQHELGHIYYYLYYNQLPMVYQAGANDGFHEGIGDTLTLSMTPKYLQEIGLLENFEPNEQITINEQMQSALEKIAFLPFGLLIDEWRWSVFNGTVGVDQYNSHWWKLREELQGVAAPSARGEEHFDPGAKYHVPGNTPYLRYFLARILQFQFHKALCEASGYTGPLHSCSIYKSKEAGQKLMELLSVGASQPWQDTLEALSGSRHMSAQAMIDYYAPLRAYLEKENEGLQCGF